MAIVLADERLDGIKKVKNQFSGWQKFRGLYKSQPSITRPNMTMLLFFIPMLAVVMYGLVMYGNVDAFLPYNSYLTVGYPLSLHAYSTGVEMANNATKTLLLLLIPAAVVFSFGLAGALKTLRNSVITLEVKHKRDNLDGMKQNWYVCLAVMLVFAGIANGVFYLFGALNASGLGSVWTVIIKVIVFIACALILAWGFFVMCLHNGYKQGILRVIGNAFLMCFESIGWTIFALIITVAPLLPLLINNSLVQMIVLFYYAMIGFSAMAFTWANISIKFENRYSKYKTVSENE